jgi:hypothetical protein
MLIKILGSVDVISGLILILSGTGVNIQNIILIIIALILIGKSFIGFLKNFASWIDILAGVSLLLFIWFPFLGIVVIILGLLVIQKGIFSFL